MLPQCCGAPPDPDNSDVFVEQLPAMRGADATAADEVIPPDGFSAELRGDVGCQVGARFEASALCPAIYVSSVSDDVSTMFGGFNAEAPAHLRIRAGDFIVAAGGKTDPTRMRQLIKAAAWGPLPQALGAPIRTLGRNELGSGRIQPKFAACHEF